MLNRPPVGIFNEFTFDKLKGDYKGEEEGNATNHYVEIATENYNLINYYFQEDNGFFEILNYKDRPENGELSVDMLSREGRAFREKILEQERVFEKFYKRGEDQDGNLLDKYILEDEYRNIIKKQSPTDEEKAQFDELYAVLNHIPFEHRESFVQYMGANVTMPNIVNVQGTNPLTVWNLPDQRREQNLSHGKASEYYERYTLGQYEHLEVFVAHMEEKYGIPSETFAYSREYDLNDDNEVISAETKDSGGFVIKKMEYLI